MIRTKTFNSLLPCGIAALFCLVPATCLAADTDYDGKWTVRLSCGQHLQNGRPAFASNFELSVVNGRINEIYTQTTGAGKEDTQWDGRIDRGALILNGPSQRSDGARWLLNFTGKATGNDHISGSGSLSSDQRKVRDCSVELQLDTHAPASLAAKKSPPEKAASGSSAASSSIAPLASVTSLKAQVESALKGKQPQAPAPKPATTASSAPATHAAVPAAPATPPPKAPASRADITPLEAKLEAIAGSKLLDIVVAVTTDSGRERIRRSVSGDWTLNADSLCIDSNMLFKADGISLPFRFFPELGLNASDSSTLRLLRFYEMLKFDPARDVSGRANAGRELFGGPTPTTRAGIPSRSNAPRELSSNEDTTAVLAYALERGFQKRFGKSVRVGIDTGASCIADATLMPRAVVDPQHGARLTSKWRAGVERGTVFELFSISVAEYRTARQDWITAIGKWDQNVAGLVERLAKSPASGDQALYGALNVGNGNIKACFVTDAASAPRNGVSIEAVMRSAEFKNFLSGSISNRTRFDNIDALYADLQKSQGKCTVIIGNGPTLATLKNAIDRDKQLDGRLMPAPLDEAKLLAAHAEGIGFKNPESYLFGISIDVSDAMQVSRLQALGISTKNQFLTARKRLEQFESDSKPNVDALLQFLADEREATASRKTVKALRTERAKREDEEARRYMAALAAGEKKKAVEYPYLGLLSCSISGQKTNVQACLSSSGIETEVELRNGSEYRMYKIHDINQIGNWDGNDLRIDLRKNFELKAQNADKTLILTLVLKDRASGKLLFQKSAAMFGVINVQN
jgi:hypothetical protein